MYTKVKTKQEIDNLRIAGKMCAEVLSTMKLEVKPGISTKKLADIARKQLANKGGSPAFLGYHEFPDVICISVNDEVVHGIPKITTIIKAGDIVSFDFGVIYNGMIVDNAISVLVDSDDSEKKRLLENTKKSLEAGLSVLKDNCKTGDIGQAVEKVLNREKLGIVRDLVGHGVGHAIHEEPNIPNYGEAGTGFKLKSGMTIAIEPMATLGSENIFVDKDKWTVKTTDKSLSAHFEQTVLIKKNGYEILTPFL
ncbi:MAG TPA: type I methionyl aminopeptidase [Candidatus Saccharimonadales bacterium]|nr:type I methionyl aminopeptidase [Candidatus Saccharimonadales bacterium]